MTPRLTPTIPDLLAQGWHRLDELAAQLHAEIDACDAGEGPAPMGSELHCLDILHEGVVVRMAVMVDHNLVRPS